MTKEIRNSAKDLVAKIDTVTKTVIIKKGHFITEIKFTNNEVTIKNKILTCG